MDPNFTQLLSRDVGRASQPPRQACVDRQVCSRNGSSAGCARLMRTMHRLPGHKIHQAPLLLGSGSAWAPSEFIVPLNFWGG